METATAQPLNPSLPAEHGGGGDGGWLLWLTVGVVARLLISWNSFGTDDAHYWSLFASELNQHGLLQLYRDAWAFNHPPLPAFCATMAQRLAIALGLPFVVVFRMLPIAADVVIFLALTRFWRRRGRPRWLPALLALGPISLIVSAHHTNTDSVYAMFTLLGVLVAARNNGPRGDFLAGALLGLALNIKLLPIVVLLALLAGLPVRRGLRVGLGALPFALPYLVLAAVQPQALTRNILGYSGYSSWWGPPLLIYGASVLRPGPAFIELQKVYHEVGRWLVLALPVALGLRWQLARRRATAPLSAEEEESRVLMLGAGGAAAFFALGSSFAPQYFVMLGPLMLAAAPRWGAAWSIAGGLFLLLAYYGSWEPRMVPIFTHSVDVSKPPLPLIGLVPWAICVLFVVRCFRAAKRPDVTGSKG